MNKIVGIKHYSHVFLIWLRNALFVLLGASVIMWALFFSAKYSFSVRMVSLTNIQFDIAPKLSKEDIAMERDSMNKLKVELEEYIKQFKGHYGIYYYNLVSQVEFGINDEEEYVAASTVKIPLNLFLYDRIKTGTVNAFTKMTYKKEDAETGTGILQYQPFGTLVNVKDLSRYSIRQSDNVATNMLFRLVGYQNTKDFMRKLGGRVVYDDKNISSPRDMGLYMKAVYDFYQQETKLGDELMNNFMKTDFNDRIPLNLPSTVKVAHKIGNQVCVCNDVAIVFDQTPYILSILSKDIDESVAPMVLANISEKVYKVIKVKP